MANMLRVPGFEFARSAERVLATGDNHVDYYTKNPELVGAALMGYSWAIVEKCQRQVPGGTTSLRYSLSRDGFEEDSAVFTVPRDFVPIFKKLGNRQGLRIDYMVVSAKKQPAYTDVIKLIDAKGCSNIAVTSYHRNLSEVLNKVRADWYNLRGLRNLFRSIMPG